MSASLSRVKRVPWNVVDLRFLMRASPWNHSPSTAAVANRPSLVKALAERIFRRIQSRGQATPCVPTQGLPVLPDCPTLQVNAIALKGRQTDMNFGAMPLFDMRLAIAHSDLRYDLLSE